MLTSQGFVGIVIDSKAAMGKRLYAGHVIIYESRPVEEGGWILLTNGEAIEGFLADVLLQSDPSLVEPPSSLYTHIASL
jgi:hypothetical protein